MVETKTAEAERWRCKFGVGISADIRYKRHVEEVARPCLYMTYVKYNVYKHKIGMALGNEVDYAVDECLAYRHIVPKHRT